MEDVEALARLVEALRPWLDRLAFVGGWAHRLHRLHPSAQVPGYAPLRTLDADLALSLGERMQGDMSAALAAAGFRETLTGDHHPPVSRYDLGVEGGGFYAEFLAPLSGSGYRRDGSPDATATVGGVTAQKLRHVDMLLHTPLTVTLTAAAGVPVAAPIDVRLANPVAFIAQKLLIRDGRKPPKRAQDLLYIHDTIELFGASLDDLRSLWLDHVRPTLHQNHAASVERLAGAVGREITDDIREAARMPQDRALTPEGLRQVLAAGLAAVFLGP
jgi:hypothetical protein